LLQNEMFGFPQDSADRLLVTYLMCVIIYRGDRKEEINALHSA
jgi:hypothetical protein